MSNLERLQEENLPACGKGSRRSRATQEHEDRLLSQSAIQDCRTFTSTQDKLDKRLRSYRPYFTHKDTDEYQAAVELEHTAQGTRIARNLL